MPRLTASDRRAAAVSAWASLLFAAARLTLSPSASSAQLVRGNPQERAPDTAMLMDAARAVCPAAVPERDPPALEVAEELVPLGVGRRPVLFAGPELAAAGDERPVAGDGFLGIDGFIANCGVYVLVSEYQLGDVRRHPVQDGIGGEDPPEVVGQEVQRFPVGAGDAGRGERAADEGADALGGDRPVLQPDDPLEQQRHRRVPGALVRVIGRDQRDGAVVSADPGDDCGQDVRQLRVDDEKPLLIGLRRGDRQQRDQFAGGRDPVLDQAVVRELCQLLEPDARLPQYCYGGPCPERVAFLPDQVPPLPAVRFFGPDPAGGPGQPGPAECLPAGGEQLSWPGCPGGVQPGRGIGAAAVDGGGEDEQDGEPFAGPLVHAGLGPGLALLELDVAAADRAGNGPRPPAGGLVQRPLPEVEIEGPDGHQDVVSGLPPDDLLPAAGRADGPGLEALLPPGGDVGRQPQRVDARMAGFQVLPEPQRQRRCQAREGAVVDARLAFAQVVHEQVADRPAGKVIPVDQLLDGELPGEPGADHPDAGRRSGREDPGRVQELVDEGAVPVGAAPVAEHLPAAVQQLHAVAWGDVADQAALGRHDEGGPLD